jgi:energy-coupling factor transporter ATP-binding protein EcfA2
MQEIDTLRAQGMAVAIATHDLALATEWADRVMVLDGGRIAFEGTPRLLMQDGSALAGAGQRATPLVRMLRLATERGADVPSFIRWRDLPGWP